MEHKRKCNVCGKIYCFTDEDLQNNAKNAGISALEALGGLASSLGGGTIFHTQYLQGQSDRYADKVVDYDQCPYCHSRDVSVYIGEVKTPAPAIPEPVAAKRLIDSGASTEALLKRAYIFLEDEDWEAADAYCEACLDRDPELARAYLGKLLAELELTGPDMLSTCSEPFDESKNYKKALRYADDGLRNQLTDILEQIRTNNENSRKDALLSHAREIMERGDSSADFQEALGLLQTIPGWKDADTLAKLCQGKLAEAIAREQEEAEAARLQEEARRIQAERDAEIAKEKTRKAAKLAAVLVPLFAIVIVAAVVISGIVQKRNDYNTAVACAKEGEYDKAIALFASLGDYEDCAEQIEMVTTEKRYSQAVTFEETGDYENAIKAFYSLGNYKDSSDRRTRSQKAWYDVADDFSADGDASAALVIFWRLGEFQDAKARSKSILISLTERKVIDAGDKHTVGLKADGTVLAAGDNSHGQCDVSGWTGIVAITAGDQHTVGLKADGTVLATGDNSYGQCDVSRWTDIVSVSAGHKITIALKSDGTVVEAGLTSRGVYNWSEITAISAGEGHVVGLKADGTVVAEGYSNYDGECNVSDLTDIVSVSAGDGYTVALKKNGTVEAIGFKKSSKKYYNPCDVSRWRDVVAIDAAARHNTCLKADGTVDVVGRYFSGETRVSSWKNISAICGGGYNDGFTVGVTENGTAIAIGDNSYGQCNVSDWTDIKQPK